MSERSRSPDTLSDGTPGPDAAPNSPVAPADASHPAWTYFTESVLSIDLGSHFSRVALLHPSEKFPTLLRNDLANEATFTGVAYPDNSERLVGDLAAQFAISRPAFTLTRLPTLLGTDLSVASAVEALLQDPAHHVKISEGGFELPGAGCPITPSGATACLIQGLLGYARQHCHRILKGKPLPPHLLPSRLVLAVPAALSATARACLVDAACIAGFSAENVSVVEDIAAAAAYAAMKLPVEPRTVVIVNVGSEYSAAGVVSFRVDEAGLLEHRLCPVGKTALGSRCIDLALYANVLDAVSTKNKGKVDIPAKGRVRILQDCRKAKEVLSAVDSATVSVEAVSADGELDVREVLERPAVDAAAVQLIGALETALVTSINEAVKAGILPAENPASGISSVEVVGGGWRTPSVKAAIAKATLGEDANVSTMLDAATAVVLGAALLRRCAETAEARASAKAAVAAASAEEATAKAAAAAAEASASVGDQKTGQDSCAVPSFDGFIDVSCILTSTQLAAARELEAVLSARDERYLALAAARNKLETLCMTTRGKVTSSKLHMAKLDQAQMDAIAARCDEELNWVSDEESTATLSELASRHDAFDEWITANYPEIAAADQDIKKEEDKRTADLAAAAAKASLEPREAKSDVERLRMAKQRRDQGNDLFKKGDHQAEASQRYVQALQLLNEMYGCTDEQKVERDSLYLSCYLNLASISVQTKNWVRARENCKKALELDPNHPKAHFRMGQTLTALGEFSGSSDSLKRALELCPGDAGIMKAQKLNDSAREAARKKEQEMAARMFSALG